MYTLIFAALLCAAFALPSRRTAINVASASYDYVVVGCGIGGLVVTSRLSENPDISVLCIEAGPFDDYEPMIMFPIYIGAGIGTKYDWNLTSASQSQLSGKGISMPMGRGVGGGSLINGMIWNRGNQDDYDAWADFGNPGWTWNDLLPYFQKSETYTPIYANDSEQLVTFDPKVHGFDGPVQISYPGYFWPQSENWVAALKSLGIPESFDPNEGLSAGGFYLPANIHPVNQTRSDARRTYYDPLASRANFDVLANTIATRVLFTTGNTTVDYNSTTTYSRSQVRATAVEYASGPEAPCQTVFATKEVILSAGALHSPQLLQLSGIGPSTLLQNLSIPIIQDLIGVGNNLQDHCMIHLNYPYMEPGLLTPYSVNYNQSLNDACEAEFVAFKTGPWAGRPSTALAFPALSQITNDTETMVNATYFGDRFYPDGYDMTLQEGYELQFVSILDRLLSNNTPAYENLNNNAGGLDISLQHPLSRGTVMISTKNPFEAPVVDPRWLTNPLDVEVMVRAIQFNQQILETPSMQEMMPSFTQVPPNATTEQITELLRTELSTEFHYSGTCAMLPLELGGVVDSNLIVYGTQNLRVVDTSIFPLVPAAHLQAPIFAVAEKAADLIKGPNATTFSSYIDEPAGPGALK